MKPNKIQFLPTQKEPEIFGEYPTPATKHIPEWYKKIPATIGGQPFTVKNRDHNLSIKSCPPILDSFTMGYMATLTADIQVRRDESGLPVFFWIAEDEVATIHRPDTTQGFAVPKGYHPLIYKFHGKWGIITPKGYSCLITHPLNRSDLPFISFSGIIETDSFPFFDVSLFIREDFEGIIEAGTPIAQIIPFRRESWESEIIPYSDSNLDPFRKLAKKVRGAYKANSWQRKTFQ